MPDKSKTEVKAHYQTCQLKQEEIKKKFLSCPTKESRYQKIIELGKTLRGVPSIFKTEEYLVTGCQSRVYLCAELCEGRMHFSAESEALISAGLAALLIKIYSDEFPEVILKCPPLFIEELGLLASLSPNRSNGFSSIYLRMKQEALKYACLSN